MNEEILAVLKSILEALIYTKRLDKYDLAVIALRKKPLLCSKDIMVLFQVSMRTVERWRRDKTVPCKYVNGKPFHTWAGIQPLLDEKAEDIKKKLLKKNKKNSNNSK